MSCQILLFLTSLAVGLGYGQVLDCNLYTGAGCVSNGAFAVGQLGLNNVSNSQCQRTAQLTITLPAGYRGYGCYFFMDVPEQGKSIYNFAETPTARAGDALTAYIEGVGLDVFVSTKTGYTASSSLFLNNVHTDIDDNHNSYVGYLVYDNALTTFSSQQTYATINNNVLFNPISRKSYVGLNRAFASTANQGSGLCRAYCFLQSAFTVGFDGLSSNLPGGLINLPAPPAPPGNPTTTPAPPKTTTSSNVDPNALAPNDPNRPSSSG